MIHRSLAQAILYIGASYNNRRSFRVCPMSTHAVQGESFYGS